MSESGPRRDLHTRIPELAKEYALEQAGDEEEPDFEFVGHGGDQVVFKIKQQGNRKGKFRSIVAKASMFHIRQGLESWVREQVKIAPSEASQDAVQTRSVMAEEQKGKDRIMMERELEREKSFYHQVRKFFPQKAILDGKARIQTVPIGPKVAAEILEDLGHEGTSSGQTHDIETIVRYQDILPEHAELGKDGASSFGMRYVERMNIPFAEYVRFNQQTLLATDAIDTKLFFRSLHGQTRELLMEARTDDDLKKVLQDLVERIVDFTNTSGEMLDIAGQGNIRVYKDLEGQWKYLLVDVYAGIDWSNAVEAAQGLPYLHSSLPRGIISDLTNGVNYTRTVNGMAGILGVKKKIHLFDERSTYESTIRMFSTAAIRVIQKTFSWPDKKEFPDPKPGVVDSTSLEVTEKRPTKDKA